MFRNVWHYLIQTFDWPHRKKEKRREGKEEEDKKGSANKQKHCPHRMARNKVKHCEETRQKIYTGWRKAIIYTTFK